MERTLAMFLKENPFDYDAEQLCRLKQEIDHPQDGRSSDEKIDCLLWQRGQKSRQESFCCYVVRNFPCRRYPHLLEVGCGRQARLSQLLAQQGYQMSAIDPKLQRIPAHVEGIVASFHHARTPISSYDAVIAQEPCDATEHIVRSCIRERKDFVISLRAQADQRRTAGFRRGLVSLPGVARSCTYRDHLSIDHSGICDTDDDRPLPVMNAERKESGTVIFA